MLYQCIHNTSTSNSNDNNRIEEYRETQRINTIKKIEAYIRNQVSCYTIL